MSDTVRRSNPYDWRDASTESMYSRTEIMQAGLFWSWNLIFLAFMSLGFGPIMLPQLFVAVRTGLIPPMYLAFALLLAAIPAIAVILGLTMLRNSPAKQFAFGYVVEGPLMLMLAVRFFAIRQGTAASAALLLIALSGMLAFLWTLLDQRSGQRHTALEALRAAGLALMALTSVYAALWLAFYALPLGAELGRAVFEWVQNAGFHLQNLVTNWRQEIVRAPLMLAFSATGFVLIMYTATLFVLAPIAVPILSLRVWLGHLRQMAGRWGRLRPALLAGGALLLALGLAFLANRQPQAQAFALLEEPPASPQQARALLQRSNAIRAGLLNAYLSPFRYISAEGEVRHITDLYQSAFHMPRPDAFRVQRLYETLASPLLYQPVHRPDASAPVDNHALVQEPQEAAHLYQQFFDAPIAEAERDTIVRAVRNTWASDQAEAAWQAVDDREVHLEAQEVTVQPYGDWAEVELHEAYRNQTGQNQEVIYYFNLPESAVLTGLWLGNSPIKQHAFRFQVAPRGAAQAVYREQTRVQKDPALLEQIGPRQYRLRAFPIPPIRSYYDERTRQTVTDEAEPMHLWLQYRVMADAAGWPLPRMALLRNVYWDGQTERTLNGAPLPAGDDEWLPASAPVAQPVEVLAHRVDLPGGQTVLAVPAASVTSPALPEGLRLAVAVDRSRSMEPYAAETAAALEQLRAFDTPETPVDVYLTSSPFRGEDPALTPLSALNPQDIVYFGGQNAAQLLGQFEALRATERSDAPYDALIVLTDGTGYELGETGDTAPQLPFPVWVVHLSGEIPLGYDDSTLDAIQTSGGGVAGSLDEALSRLAVGLAAAPGSAVDLVDGYEWRVLPAGEEPALPEGVGLATAAADDPFAALAARRLVLAEQQRNRGTISDVSTLDALHALAMQYEIVTPYSSMLVLVNLNQQLLLDKLAQQGDRYQREVEGLGDTAPGSPVPLAGVPEPHEWLLIGLGLAMLAYLWRRQRLATAGQVAN